MRRPHLFSFAALAAVLALAFLAGCNDDTVSQSTDRLQKNIYLIFDKKPDSVTFEAVVTGDGLSEPIHAELLWAPVTKVYTTIIYLPPEGTVWKIEVLCRDLQGRKIGRTSQDFDRAGQDVVIPAFSLRGLLPWAGLEAPSEVSVNDVFTVSAQSEDVSPGRIVSTEWDLEGDGTFAKGVLSQQTVKAPSQPGTMTIGYRATDDDGNVATAAAEVNVIRDYPTVTLSAKPDTVTIKDSVTLSASAHTRFGKTPALSLDPGNGAAPVPWSGRDTLVRVPDTAGLRRFRVRAVNDDGDSALASASVLVLLDNPSVSIDGPARISVTKNDSFVVAAQAFDARGRIVKWEWDFGNTGTFQAGTAGPYPLKSGSAYGTTRHVVRVTDDDGLTALDTLEVTVVPNPPHVDIGRDQDLLLGQPIYFYPYVTDNGTIVSKSARVLPDTAWTPLQGNAFSTVPATPGTYTAIARAIDDDGEVGYDTVLAVVRVKPPDSLPKDTLPKDTLPKDTLPKDTLPKDTLPKDTIPSDAKAKVLSGTWLAQSGESEFLHLVPDHDDVIAYGNLQGTLSLGGLSRSSAYRDAFLGKITAGGAVPWLVSTSGMGLRFARGLGVNSQGDMALGGKFQVDTMTFDTLKIGRRNAYDGGFAARAARDGHLRWLRAVGAVGDHDVKGAAITAGGEVYLVGDFTQAVMIGSDSLAGGSGRDVFVAKLDAQGNLLWLRKAGGGGDDVADAAAVDADGNLYVTGMTSGGAQFGTHAASGFGDCAFLAKYDGSGNVQWVKTIQGTKERSYMGAINMVAAEPDGSIVVAMTTYQDQAVEGKGTVGGSGGDDALVVKYAAATGAVLWTHLSRGIRDERLNAMAVDAQGSIYLAGHFDNEVRFGSVLVKCKGYLDIFLAKLTPSGALDWLGTTGTTAQEYPKSLAVGSSGTMYLGGRAGASTVVAGKTVTGVSDFLLILSQP